MTNNEVNTVVLSKSSYDNMRGTNDRASMLLREIMDSMSIANDCNDLSIDNDKILKTIEVLYPDTFKKKVSYLKTVRTKNLGQIISKQESFSSVCGIKSQEIANLSKTD